MSRKISTTAFDASLYASKWAGTLTRSGHSCFAFQNAIGVYTPNALAS